MKALTREQLAELRRRMAANRQPDEEVPERRAFLRGWNAASDHIEQWIRELLGEPVTGEGQGHERTDRR